MSYYYPLFFLICFYNQAFAFSQADSFHTISTKMSYAMSADKESIKKNKQLKPFRKLFVKANAAIDQNNNKKYQQYLQQLNNYPLVTFLEYKQLRKNLFKAKEKTVDDFIKANEQTPYADKIRTKWLDLLAKKKRWQTYLRFYTPQKSIRRQCEHLQALMSRGKKQQVFEQVQAIWLTNKSRPKSCDVIFKAWENAGFISRDLRWQRIQLVMAKGRISLAKYIARPMSKTDKAILTQWISLHRKPQKLNNSSILFSKHKMQQEIIVHSLKRRARKKPQYAAELLNDIKQKVTLKPENLNQIYRAIGLSFARKHQAGAWFWLSKIDDNSANLYTKEWRVRAAIREQKTREIISAIKRLPLEEQQSQRWKFWLANASEKLGNKTIADKIYKKLALKRGYYAFLAADKMELKYEFNDSPIVYNAEKFAQIKQHPGIQRAYEFLVLGMQIEAKREWFFVTKKVFDQSQNIMAAKLAQSWGWHDRAIITIAKTGEWDDINLRFPLMLEKAVEKYSRLNNIDAAYTYAVIRRESAFAIEARSPVGAMGLMQIMPATGKGIAKKLKLAYKNKIQLYSSDFNLKLGTNYLNEMLGKFYQQPVLASAAYNAGGHRVKAWLPKDKALNAMVWVETIPFQETRAYVSAILAYTAIYQHRLSQPITRLTQRMPDVPFKK
ncbi:MAG: transglycosylase SLT domain-containing protein [Pseudomonadota bacterium]